MSWRPKLSQGISDLSVVENGEPDKEWVQRQKEKLNEDLNLILVIVGLLSAVITSFMLYILYIQPKLDPDPNDESTALLRILVYNTNKTAFGGKVPEVPQWTGAPVVLVVSECLLCAALLTALVGGLYALLIRLASALNSRRSFRWILYKFSPFVIWATIFTLWCAFGLLFLAVTLQLPFIVDAFSP